MTDEKASHFVSQFSSKWKYELFKKARKWYFKLKFDCFVRCCFQCWCYKVNEYNIRDMNYSFLSHV